MHRFTHCLALVALVAGMAGTAAVAQIRVGQTIDLTGGSSEHGKAVLAGIRAYLDPVNAAGGVNGRKVELVTLDDGGNGERAAKNTRDLIERERVVAIFSGIEGGPCTASLRVAVALKVPLVGCAAGAPELREPFNRYVFPVRAAHLHEFEVIIRGAAQFGRTRIAFVHADSENGRRHLANVKRIAQKEGAEVVAEVALASGKADAAAIAKAIVAKRAQAVINHGGYSTYAEIYRQARALDPTIQFYAVNSGAQQMVRQLGPSAEGLVFTQVVPFPWGAIQPVVREYQLAMRRHAPKDELSFSSLEGFINAKLLVAALRRTSGQATPEALVRALEDAGEIDLGGFRVSYASAEHAGSSFVDTVFTRKDGRFRAR